MMKILFTGDVNFGKHIYGEELSRRLLAPIERYFAECDFVLPNLECALGNEEDFSPIKKAGPNLICDAGNLAFIKAMGAYGVTAANNHIGDFGEEAVRYTLGLLDENGIVHAGAGRNAEDAYKPMTLTKDGVTVSVISVCENEFGTATDDGYGAAGLNERLLYKTVRNEKEKGNKVVIVFHGGNEHCPVPSSDTVERFRFFCDFGADAVIGGHTHCPQATEIYDGKPIAYSMGNFIFPKPAEQRSRDSLWFYGYMCILDIGETVTLKTVPYKFDIDNDRICDLSGDTKFCSYLALLNETVGNEKLNEKCFDKWVMQMLWCPTLPETENGEFKLDGYNSPLNYNWVKCESHHAKLKATFKLLFEESIGAPDPEVDRIFDFKYK